MELRTLGRLVTPNREHATLPNKQQYHPCEAKIALALRAILYISSHVGDRDILLGVGCKNEIEQTWLWSV